MSTSKLVKISLTQRRSSNFRFGGMAVYACRMARPPKEGSRKNNPNYSPVTAQIPKLLGKKLRLFVAQEETTISEVVEAALEEYIDKRMVQSVMPIPQVESFTDLIKVNLLALMSSEKVSPDRLKELAFGKKPSTAELAMIANVLDVAEEFIVELRDRSFPKNSKPKQTNGTS